jgi:hypothetical protein
MTESLKNGGQNQAKQIEKRQSMKINNKSGRSSLNKGYPKGGFRTIEDSSLDTRMINN